MAEEKKEYIIGKQVIHEDDLEFKVDYKGESFTLRYPTPLVRNQIDVAIARQLGGMPRESFSQDSLAQIEMTAYINAIIVPDKCPEWFQKNVNTLWEYYDEMLILELYRGYVNFRDRFRDDLSKGRFEIGRAGSIH